MQHKQGGRRKSHVTKPKRKGKEIHVKQEEITGKYFWEKFDAGVTAQTVKMRSTHKINYHYLEGIKSAKDLP